MGENFTSPYLADYDKDGAVDLLFYNKGTQNFRIIFNKVPAKQITYDGLLCFNPVT